MRDQALKQIDKDELLTELNNSATFAMSRGGRELFHTNFLAHILEIETKNIEEIEQKGITKQLNSYTLDVKKAIINQLFVTENKPKNVRAFRERKNLDLILIPEINELNKVREIVVIEAKLKSIPTREQLDKYNQSLNKSLNLELFDDVEFNTSTMNESEVEADTELKKNIIKVSLKDNTISLIESDRKKFSRTPNELKIDNITVTKRLLSPSFTYPDKLEDTGWELLDWSKFLNTLIEVPTTSPDKNETAKLSLLDSLVKDYIDSTKKLLDLANESYKMANSFISNDNIIFKQFHKYIESSEFKKVRVHDLIGKIAYFKLQEHMRKDLEQKYQKSHSDFKFDSYTFYTRATPLFVIQFKKTINDKTSLRIGVQVQGNQYRHFIQREGLDEAQPTLDECAECIKKWMCSITEEDNKQFGAFTRARFIHNSIKIEDEFTYKDLNEKINKSLDDAIELLKTTNGNEFIAKFMGTA